MDTLILYGSYRQVALYLSFDSYLLDCFSLSLSLSSSKFGYVEGLDNGSSSSDLCIMLFSVLCTLSILSQTLVPVLSGALEQIGVSITISARSDF